MSSEPYDTPNVVTNQVVLSTSASLVVSSKENRRYAEVKNADAAINVYLGDTNSVSSAVGHLLKPGEAFGFEKFFGEVWAVAASGTPTLTTIEW